MAIFCHNISVGDLFVEINLTNSFLCQNSIAAFLYESDATHQNSFHAEFRLISQLCHRPGFQKHERKKYFLNWCFFWSGFHNFFSGVGFITYQLGKVFRANNDLIGTFLNLGIQKKVELSNIIWEGYTNPFFCHYCLY